ncbi:MAG TPA: 5'-nucleotidase C-terminal domain-containing protein [Bacteroidia bacterium]|nr:5'-nucleotidase C-terminal domain-containing protein [Bacteroidia bacterium]
MNFRFQLMFILLLLITGCGSTHVIRSETKVIALVTAETAAVDSAVYYMIEPYRIAIAVNMDETIGETEKAMERAQPEGLLGNFVADACMSVAEKYYYPEDNVKIDFCLMNNGGLRAPLPQGKITRRNIFELMPLENSLTVLTLKGETVEKVLTFVAVKGGMPVSKIKMQIRDTAAINIEVAGKSFDREKNYRMVTSDYLANGGDGLFFLSAAVKREDLNMKVRDALLEYIGGLTKAGKKISAKAEGRITYAP